MFTRVITLQTDHFVHSFSIFVFFAICSPFFVHSLSIPLNFCFYSISRPFLFILSPFPIHFWVGFHFLSIFGFLTISATSLSISSPCCQIINVEHHGRGQPPYHLPLSSNSHPRTPNTSSTPLLSPASRVWWFLWAWWFYCSPAADTLAETG